MITIYSPVSPKIGKIAVIGPFANIKEFAYSDYSYPAHIEDMFHLTKMLTEDEVIATTLFFKKENTQFDDLFNETKTIYQAICDIVSEETEVFYAKGLTDTCNYHNDPDFYHLEEAIRAASQADIVISVCGDTSGIGRDNDSGESVDRAEIHLSNEQQTLLKALKNIGKPIVLILCNGRPLSLSYESEHMNAILEAWRPGMEGADAIAETLFGQSNPGGKLPVTLPKCIGQLPMYYSQHATGKKQFWRNTYLEVDTKPLYPFGYGLSYTSFTFEDILMTQQEEGISVNLTLYNNGSIDGDEVIQLYVRKRFTTVIQPERELKAYKRLFVKKGKRIRVSFELFLDSLCYHNLKNQLGLENCQLDVLVGSSSEDICFEQSFRLYFEDGIRLVKRRIFTNPAYIISD